ncbi:hypothetical protein D9X91_13155 [Falsibacillus albus]|uniref:Uncharacterized protein n=1 Tax=Falsibacillus albus TaxID=2478915 RepID=A0A3L7JUA5_9BACI|nr:hypothetical protein D9X91_13155 [Falsibacillus albus]
MVLSKNEELDGIKLDAASSFILGCFVGFVAVNHRFKKVVFRCRMLAFRGAALIPPESRTFRSHQLHRIA